MITFTHDENLILRWLVFDAKDKIPADKRAFLLAKIDHALAQDGEMLRIHRGVLIDSM